MPGVRVAKKKVQGQAANEGKAALVEIVSKLTGLIRSNSPDRNV